MFARLVSVWERLRDGLWALPLLMVAASFGLALLALSIEAPALTGLAWLYHGNAALAPDFASSLVSAMITVTALALSITMVVLTLAAQQLGPRLIQIFMRDVRTQAAIGMFLGTSVYLLMVLRSLEGQGNAPNLAITLGTVLVFASLLTLLLFVHVLSRSIVADHIIARVGAKLDDAIDDTFTESAGENEDEAPAGGAPVRLKARGYVQRIDHGAIARVAHACGAQVVLAYRAGAHVLDGETDAWVSGAPADKLEPALARGVVFASERGEGQDPQWPARQLVEVALRALSPGINDVFTAIAVIDRLARAMARLAGRGEARQVWRDSEGVARVFAPAITFDDMMDACFDQIRAAGADKHRILMRLAENLAKLAALTAGGPRFAAVRRHLDLTASAARRAIAEASERAEIEAMIAAGRTASDGRKLASGE